MAMWDRERLSRHVHAAPGGSDAQTSISIALLPARLKKKRKLAGLPLRITSDVAGFLFCWYIVVNL